MEYSSSLYTSKNAESLKRILQRLRAAYACIYVFGDRDWLFSFVEVFGLHFFLLVLFIVILIQVGEVRIIG
jgi:hypothetical protein